LGRVVSSSEKRTIHCAATIQATATTAAATFREPKRCRIGSGLTELPAAAASGKTTRPPPLQQLLLLLLQLLMLRALAEADSIGRGIGGSETRLRSGAVRKSRRPEVRRDTCLSLLLLLRMPRRRQKGSRAGRRSSGGGSTQQRFQRYHHRADRIVLQEIPVHDAQHQRAGRRELGILVLHLDAEGGVEVRIECSSHDRGAAGRVPGPQEDLHVRIRELGGAVHDGESPRGMNVDLEDGGHFLLASRSDDVCAPRGFWAQKKRAA
jgi:hypothetical protein